MRHLTGLHPVPGARNPSASSCCKQSTRRRVKCSGASQHRIPFGRAQVQRQQLVQAVRNRVAVAPPLVAGHRRAHQRAPDAMHRPVLLGFDVFRVTSETLDT